ncbi:hypothetical protein BCIN_12g02400 [Botrytis cinerea B05.10]|uniref:Uncharacterized protein n=1 Tax=Botryotinia fuckeliana (strain B05.10) TaxID=332648 RepID=A0A384JYQ2_BOTFB|nr:hypothetical protein BCIN_12g02400 [Botrytis cinerea B05.10]ATZ55668.1 hypothetical protein BCIN_12g02400 [Botrytis cinerea B05.10]
MFVELELITPVMKFEAFRCYCQPLMWSSRSCWQRN